MQYGWDPDQVRWLLAAAPLLVQDALLQSLSRLGSDRSAPTIPGESVNQLIFNGGVHSAFWLYGGSQTTKPLD